MAPYAVSEEAVRQLRLLADSLYAVEDEIRQEIQRLRSCFDGQQSGLGCHASSIEELLGEVEETARSAAQPTTKLALKLLRAAAIRESILRDNPYGKSGRSSGSGGSGKGGSFVTIGGVRHRTDDNGKPYARRDGESGQYGLLPDTSYQLNGYQYETNSDGGIARVTGTLRRKGKGKRKPLNTAVPGMLEGDERGHLIGDQFDGSNQPGNLVAMGFDLNHGRYLDLEKIWASALKEDRQVAVDIQPRYEGGSPRPTVFSVIWEVDGVPHFEFFEN